MRYFRKCKAGGGFSLVEMLIVLTVLGVLFAIAAPNLFNLMQATSLTSEGGFLRNKLAQAQQLALSTNADVEVRFYKVTDLGAAILEPEFRAFKFFQYDDFGELSAVTGLFRIKPPVFLDESQSTLLTPGGGGDDAEYGFVSPSRGKDLIPVAGGEAQDTEYVAFRFRPDGSTDLPNNNGDADTWYITLLEGNSGGSGALPTNYYIVQVDPFNGSLKVYRP